MGQKLQEPPKKQRTNYKVNDGTYCIGASIINLLVDQGDYQTAAEVDDAYFHSPLVNHDFSLNVLLATRAIRDLTSNKYEGTFYLNSLIDKSDSILNNRESPYYSEEKFKIGCEEIDKGNIKKRSWISSLFPNWGISLPNIQIFASRDTSTRYSHAVVARKQGDLIDNGFIVDKKKILRDYYEKPWGILEVKCVEGTK